MIDRYKRKINYLRISVTDRCSLRCTYCMPAEGVKLIEHNEVLSFEEIYQVTKQAVELGITKVRLTGGEPLVRRGILGLVSMISSIEEVEDFAMTSNGIHLSEFAQPLIDAGLHRLNISLDTVNPLRFSEITRGGDLAKVLAGLNAAKEVGFSTIKLNCVIQKSSSKKDAQEVARFGKREGFEVRFIKQMNIDKGTFWTVEGGTGGICSQCNRLRLSSNGNIYPCLFNDIYFNIRELGITEALKKAVDKKPESGTRSNNNEFYTLGG